MDHRIAMTFSIGALNAEGPTIIEDSSCVDVSYPDFYEQLDLLQIRAAEPQEEN